jgi:Flp pilus assembly pilin Flp
LDAPKRSLTYAFLSNLPPQQRSITMLNRIAKLGISIYREEEAATTVEYALLIALILVFSISAVLSTGDFQKAVWTDTSADIQIIGQ